jgi:hypothetical protein
VAPSGQLGPCYPVFAKTVSYMNRCFPDPQALVDLAVEVGDSVEVGGKSVSDIVGDEIGSNLQVRDPPSQITTSDYSMPNSTHNFSNIIFKALTFLADEIICCIWYLGVRAPFLLSYIVYGVITWISTLNTNVNLDARLLL